MIQPIIGLEIHVQLKTKSKMFCGCDAKYFGADPNTHMCPVCLGLPGALPRANKEALKQAVKAGIALNCEIHNYSRFDRKNYMYPDLFKGYQITQYDHPICGQGHIEITLKDGQKKRIGITRAHQEEDTAKSIHETNDTLIDGNKAGVPLLEIVSEPDMASIEEATAFAEYVYNALRFIGVSNCDMEKGQMRFDVNINLQITKTNEYKAQETIATPIVEVKNLNSFRSMQRAISYEITRQEEEYEKTGIAFGKGNKTTRGWSDDKGYTYLLRSKEEAEDYRYFPEPDLPAIYITDEEIAKLRTEVGKLPSTVYTQLIAEDLHPDSALFFSSNRSIYDFLLATSTAYESMYGTHILKPFANIIKDQLVFLASEELPVEMLLTAKQLASLQHLIDTKEISSTIAKDIIKDMIATPTSPSHDALEIIKQKGIAQVDDTDAIDSVIDMVIAQNESAVLNYKSGKVSALMFLVGQVMREMKGQANPEIIKQRIENKLS